MTRESADFIAKTNYDVIPEKVREDAKRRILNYIGVTLAGSTRPEGKMIVELVKELGGKEEATITASDLKSSCVNAAWANGTMSHVVELGDWGRMSNTHSAETMGSATLAMGERQGIDGESLITAWGLGCEAGQRVGNATHPALRSRGFHANGCGFFPPGLDIIRDFVREENLKSDDVEHSKLTSYTLGIDAHTDAQPTSIVGATMSNPYCIAVVLATGKCSLNDLSLEKLHDKDCMKMVAEIGTKTEFILDPEMDKQIPGKYPATVQVRVKGGGVLDKQGDLPRGCYPEHPVDDKDLEEKFLGLARMVMNRKRAETVLGLLSELEKLKDIRDLTVFLQP